jgi:Protein of unknown function (DUF1573)
VNKKTMALLLGATLAMLGAVSAEDKAKNPPAPAKDAPATKEAVALKMVIEPAEFDFGKALQNKTLTKEFSIRNFGKEDIYIDNVTTSCGCTAAVAGEKTIKPGGNTPLRVELQTRSAVGKIERTILVHFRSPNPADTLQVEQVKVKADVIAEAPEAPAAPAAK